jgi:hypothetical protein
MQQQNTMKSLFSTLFLLLSYLFSSISQEAPFYETPKFDTTDSHRTDLCERQQELYIGNLTLSDALKGLELSVVLTNYTSEGSKPFFTLNSQGTIDPANPGLFAIILDELAERAGFSWRQSYGVVLPIDPTTDGNKTWSDLLTWEVEVYDISAGKWDRSIARMQQEISFPEGWFDSSMIMIHVDSGGSKDSLNIWSFFLPFQWSVWVLLVVAVIVTGVSYWFLERMDTSSDTRELEHHPGDAVFYTAITFTGHFEFRPQTTAAMILTFSTTFIALIIGAVYTANLASFLVARRQPGTTIDSVEQAVLLKVPICIQARVNIDDYLSYKYPEAVLVRRENNEEIFQSLHRGECSVAVMAVSEYEQYSRNSKINGDCSLQWSGKVESIIPAGFASAVDSGTLCTSLISHVLELHFIAMKSDGFLEREWEGFLQRTGDHNCIEEKALSENTGQEETFSLGVEEMAGIFIIHAMLLALALLVATAHYCRYGKNPRRSNHGSSHRGVELSSAKLPESNGDISDKDELMMMNGPHQRRLTSITDEENSGASSSAGHGLSSTTIADVAHGRVSSRSIVGGSFDQMSSYDA